MHIKINFKYDFLKIEVINTEWFRHLVLEFNYQLYIHIIEKREEDKGLEGMKAFIDIL